MTDLEQRTKTVPATSFDIIVEEKIIPKEDLLLNVREFFKMSPDEILKLREGIDTEKNKASSFINIFQEIILQILDDHTIDTQDKANKLLYQQNKKIVKDLVISTNNLLRNYSYNQNNTKIVALGKLLQSLQDGKRQDFK